MKQRKAVIYGVGGTLLLALLLISISNQTINKQLHSWKVMPEPERYSELFIADQKKAPTFYVPNSTQSVSFTIRNHETSERTYTYRILVQTASTQTVLSEGSTTIRDGQAKTIAANIVIPDLGDRVQLQTELLNRPETIHYWLERRQS